MYHITIPKYSLSALLLAILLAVVHVNHYVFPHSVLIRHVVLISYLGYGAWQYRKYMYWDFKRKDRRKVHRDPRIPADVYGRVIADEHMKASDGLLEELIRCAPASSPAFYEAYVARIKEVIDSK